MLLVQLIYSLEQLIFIYKHESSSLVVHTFSFHFRGQSRESQNISKEFL